MADLHATYNDAISMYDFLENKICKDIRDITIMSEENDYYRLWKKPQYQGNFLSQMYDWNLNKDASDSETTKLHDFI